MVKCYDGPPNISESPIGILAILELTASWLLVIIMPTLLMVDYLTREYLGASLGTSFCAPIVITAAQDWVFGLKIFLFPTYGMYLVSPPICEGRDGFDLYRCAQGGSASRGIPPVFGWVRMVFWILALLLYAIFILHFCSRESFFFFWDMLLSINLALSFWTLRWLELGVACVMHEESG